MRGNIGHARKPKPADDASASPEAVDSSAADLNDSSILTGQAVLDILESDSGAPPDQSISDSRVDTDTPVSDGDTTRNLNMSEYISRLKREMETIDSEIFLATSRIKRSPSVKTSWTQRVLSWFRSN